MESEIEAKLQAVIELCEEGDPEMCAFDRLLQIGICRYIPS